MPIGHWRQLLAVAVVTVSIGIVVWTVAGHRTYHHARVSIGNAVLVGSPGQPEAVRITVRNDGDADSDFTVVGMAFSDPSVDVRDTCSGGSDKNKSSFLCPWGKIAAHGIVSRDIPFVVNVSGSSFHEISVGIMSADAIVGGQMSDERRLAFNDPSSYETSGQPNP